MAELLTPGVIIQEVPFGPQPIEGVSTSTAGFVGEALFGPTEGPPTLVTSFPDFQRKFGGLVSGKRLGYALQGFFDNGGRRAYVARVAASTASFGEGAVQRNEAGTTVAIVGAISAGPAGSYRLTLASVVGVGATGTLELIDREGGASATLTVVSVEPSTGVVLATSPDATLAERAGTRYFVRVGDAGPPATTLLPLTARFKGPYSARLSASVRAVYASSIAVQSRLPPGADDVYELRDVSGLVVGDRLEFRRGTGERAFARVASVNAGARQVRLEGLLATDFSGGRVFLVRWRVETYFDGALVESLDVSGNPTAIASAIETESSWLAIASGGMVTLDAANPALYPTMPLARPLQFGAGAPDSPVSPSDVVGGELPRRGLGALAGQDGINLIAAPGFTNQSVVNALISQAERLQDRFAVFESDNQADVNDVLVQRGLYNSSYAAMYHPWLRIRDPLGGGDITVPPSGHVLGAFARTDNDRGVFKAPANVVLRGVLGFGRDVSTGEQDVLNPQGVNVLRRFDGLGLVIWGARTISADGLWKYVPVRRLFIFLQQSIVRGTRYAVFEPNAPPLWARIRDSVTNFLTSQWRSGALFGRTAAEAFFVKVDETTTTQDDRDNGRVNILVGIAPVKPAEFVVFQIGQAPSSVIIAEQG